MQDDAYDLYAHLQASREQAIADAVELAQTATADTAEIALGATDDGVAESATTAQEPNAIPDGVTADIDSRFPEPRRPHKVDLDIINRRLYKDRYLTPQDLLDDLERIVENAEVLGDHDRVARLRQMTLKAKLAADSFEQQWKTDWERAAVRERARRAAATAAAEKIALDAEPLRHSARAVGREPEVSMTDPAALERSLKRQRSPGGLNGGLPTAKRPKDGEDVAMNDVDLSDTPVAAVDPELAAAIPDTVLPSASPTLLSHNGQLVTTRDMQEPPVSLTPSAVTDNAPVAAASVPAGLGPDSHSAGAVSSPHTEELPASLPPFEVPAEELQSLQDSFVDDTASLNVEQLEQLRAMSLDVIWRRRADWDRTAMITELDEQLMRFIQEVKPVSAVIE